jgi:hypothetical protein
MGQLFPPWRCRDGVDLFLVAGGAAKPGAVGRLFSVSCVTHLFGRPHG